MKETSSKPKIRVLFNVLETLDTEEIFARVKSLGIEAISFFGELGRPLPDHFRIAAENFSDVNVNLIHRPTYRDKPGWRDELERDGRMTVEDLAKIGINNYVWLLECNLYGYRWNPLVGRFVHRDRLVDHFNSFYRMAHQVNPEANVIMVPYPHPLMNLNQGLRGWKDWFVKVGEKMNFDTLAMDAHVGVWIYAWGNKGIQRRLTDAIDFIYARGHSIYYIEVGYPTARRKPPVGFYGWGRERDQVEALKTCYDTLAERGVPYMQICEFIDPEPDGQIYEKFFGRYGQLPRFLGFPVREEAHWGLLRKDRSEKPACKWVREITGRKNSDNLSRMNSRESQ
jgi:hypothetical protein